MAIDFHWAKEANCWMRRAGTLSDIIHAILHACAYIWDAACMRCAWFYLNLHCSCRFVLLVHSKSDLYLRKCEKCPLEEIPPHTSLVFPSFWTSMSVVSLMAAVTKTLFSLALISYLCVLFFNYIFCPLKYLWKNTSVIDLSEYA